MKRMLLGMLLGGAIVVVGVPAVLVGGYFLLKPAEREPCDYGFVHLSDREAVVVTSSALGQRVRRVRIGDDGALADVWGTDLPIAEPLDWTVVGEHLVGATGSASVRRGELIAFRLSDGREVGRTEVRFVGELGPRWNWLPLDDGTVLVRNGPQLALATIGDGGFTDRWRVEVEDHAGIGVTPEHVVIGGEHARAFRRADGRDVTLPEELAGAKIAVSATTEELLVFSDRGLSAYPIDGRPRREIALREEDFAHAVEGESFNARFCVHGAREGAWIVSYPTRPVTREVTLTNRDGSFTSSATFDVTVFVHELAAVDTASGAVRWRLEVGEWMLACQQERGYTLQNDRSLSAHHLFQAYQRGEAVPDEDRPGDAVRYLSADLDAGAADWFVRTPEPPVHLVVRGNAAYLYGVADNGATRISRFEDGKLTGAVVSRQILVDAEAAFGADDVWVSDAWSPSWFHLHGPALAVAESRVVDPVETGMISEEDGPSLEPVLEDAFEETAALYDLPPEAVAPR